MPIFNWFRLLAMPPHKVNDPNQPETMGIGNFFLIRRSWLEKIGNFAAVRNDVAEDLRLAEILKQSGARIKTEYAPDLIKTRMYSGFAQIWQGFTKNFFAGSRFSIKKVFLNVIFIFLYGVLPGFAAIFCFLAWLAFHDNAYLWFLFPLIAVYLLQTILFAYLHAEWRLPIAYAFLAPLGLALFAAILTNSTIKIVSGSGVVWKGRTIYKRENRPPAVTEQ
jgi:hypothetical protein